MERFAGILIEHYAGRFPLWLAPLQVLILPVADRHVDAATAVRDALAAAGFRAKVDERSESVGKKIRDAELARAPYMVVLGDKEQEGETLSVRSHAEGDIGAMPLGEFVERLNAEVSSA
jgi:threonyl-tRNA synthetase